MTNELPYEPTNKRAAFDPMDHQLIRSALLSEPFFFFFSGTQSRSRVYFCPSWAAWGLFLKSHLQTLVLIHPFSISVLSWCWRVAALFPQRVTELQFLSFCVNSGGFLGQKDGEGEQSKLLSYRTTRLQSSLFPQALRLLSSSAALQF